MSQPVHAVLVGVAAAAALALIWVLAGPLLTIFAGLLVASLLDAIVRGLRQVVPLPRAPLVVAVSLGLFALAAVGLSFGGMGLWDSLDQLVRMLNRQAREIYLQLNATNTTSSDLMPDDPAAMLADFLPSSAGIFSSVQFLFGSTIGLVSNLVVILFLGIFFAVAPHHYRDGLLRLLPKRVRPEIRAAFDTAGATMRGWLVTQMVTMTIVGTLIGLLLWSLGNPNALLLGLLSGLLNFVPFLGPIFAAVPVLMTLATQDMTALAIGALGLLVIQNLEGYILTPLLQERIISLPPAWSLSTMLVMGALFGIPGVALATPFFAVARSLTMSLYVEPERAGADPPLD